MLGPFPCDAPRAVVTVMPLLSWNSGRSSWYAAEKPPDISTLTCATDMVGKATSIVIARTSADGDWGELFMRFFFQRT